MVDRLVRSKFGPHGAIEPAFVDMEGRLFRDILSRDLCDRRLVRLREMELAHRAPDPTHLPRHRLVVCFAGMIADIRAPIGMAGAQAPPRPIARCRSGSLH